MLFCAYAKELYQILKKCTVQTLTNGYKILYYLICCNTTHIGAWLSLVERCVRDAEVAGSNPVAPMKNKKPLDKGFFCGSLP